MERVRLAEIAAAAGVSLETAGRTARYDFFLRAAREAGCSRVATGHTADDAVETLLLHLLRGTGLDGLRGIPRERMLEDCQAIPHENASIFVIRPLLEVWREETEAYCASRGVAPCQDATNFDLAFARNRVRHRLLPSLEAEASPGLRRRLLALAAEVEEEVALLEDAAAALLARATRASDSDRLDLDATVLSGAPPALARRALRRAVRLLAPESELDRGATEALLRLARGDLRTGVTLPGGRLHALRRGEALTLSVARGHCKPALHETTVPLTVPGQAVLGDWGVAAREVAPPDPPAGDPGAWVLVDMAKLCGALSLRYPRPGDRVRPLGMRGHRKLHDIFVDRKLPRAERGAVPLVADEEKILWVIGFCVSEDARVDPTTGRALRLEACRQKAHADKGG
jgi:tRNA(Ile)-lysidine synthase